MKIIYLGNFKNPFSTENYIATALERAGVTVERVDKHDYEVASVKYACRDADFFLFPKLSHPIPNVKCTTVCWLFDLYFNLPEPFNRPMSKAHHFKADIVVTTDGGNEDKWQEHEINHYTVRQGVDSEGKYILPANYKYNTAFIGSISYPYRSKLIRLADKVVQEGYYAHNLNKLLSETKIVIGDSVPSPRYWSNRVYEVTGRGGFIIHPFVEGITEEFPDLVTYEHGNIEELQDKIAYYLQHDSEREEIKRKCHEVCLTYDDRVKEFLCILQKH